jgi:hypothetical protein
VLTIHERDAVFRQTPRVPEPCCSVPECGDTGADWGTEKPQPPKATLKRDNLIGFLVVMVLAGIALTVLAKLWIDGTFDEFMAARAGTPTQILADGFEDRTGGGGEIPVEACEFDPLTAPPAWQGDAKTWTQAFSGTARTSVQVVYPKGSPYPVAEGAEKGHYTYIPFTANPRQSVNIYFDQVQARVQDGYPKSRPAASMLVGLSPCPGDLRPPAYFWTDLFQSPRCRVIENSGGFTWSTDTLNPNVCHVVAGRTYVLTFAAVDTRDGLTWGEHTCEDVPNSALGCDVGVVFQSGVAPR